MTKSEIFLLVTVIVLGFSLNHYVLGYMSSNDYGYQQKMGDNAKPSNPYPAPNSMPYQPASGTGPNSMIHQPLPGTAPTPTAGGTSSITPQNACNEAEYTQAQAALASAEQNYTNLKSMYYQEWMKLNGSGKYNETWSNYAKDNLLNSTEVGKIRQIHEQYGGLAQYCYPAPQAGRSSPLPVPVATYGGTVGPQSSLPVNNTSPVPPITYGGTTGLQSSLPVNNTSANIMNTKDILMEVEQPTPIPKWIKNNARYWATDQIGDSDFTSSLQYLATNKIIHLTQPLTTNNTSPMSLPLWIKGLAGSWADGKISNDYFVSTIQFMVNQNIIKLSN